MPSFISSNQCDKIIDQSRCTFVLNLYYQNVGGMNSKIHSLFNSISTGDFDLIINSETWLSDCVYSSELVDHDLFSVFRCDRNFTTLGLSRGGGVLLLARSTLSVEMVDVSAIRKSEPSLDVVCCKVMLNSLTHVHVFVLYFPPFLTTSDFFTALKCLELMISSFSSKVLLVDDFNAPGFGCVGGGVSDSKCSAVTNFLSILNLSQQNIVYNDLGRLLDLLVADYNCEVHCAAKLSHKVKMNRSFLYFTSSAISLC
jgi:hypothetical protein